MNGTAKPALTLLLTVWLASNNLTGFSLFSPSTPPTPEETIAALKEQQADAPNDPIINYNLGVACFRNNQIGEAKTNFARSLEYAGDNNELRTRCLFNCGSSCHQLTLAMLPPTWEQKDQKIEQETLEKAITEIKQAIEHYEKFKKIDPLNKRADKKLESAKELLKKLEEKWQQQQKNDPKDNKKDQKKQQDKQQNKGDNKQQDSSSDKKQEKDGQQKTEKDQRKSDRPDDTQDPRSKPEQGQGDNKEQKKDAKDSQQPDNHEKSPDPKKPDQPENKGTQQDQEKQQSEQPGQEQPQAPGGAAQDKQEESQEMRTIRGMLDNLQDDESKTQKALMAEKMKKIAPQQQSSQKPW